MDNAFTFVNINILKCNVENWGMASETSFLGTKKNPYLKNGKYYVNKILNSKKLPAEEPIAMLWFKSDISGPKYGTMD